MTFQELLIVAVVLWFLWSCERQWERHREDIRRYNERYPFGEPKSRYERGEG